MSILSWSFWIGLFAVAIITMSTTQWASGESQNADVAKPIVAGPISTSYDSYAVPIPRGRMLNRSNPISRTTAH